MARNENSIFYGVDRVTLLVYVILVFMGWLNILVAIHQLLRNKTYCYFLLSASSIFFAFLVV